MLSRGSSPLMNRSPRPLNVEGSENIMEARENAIDALNRMLAKEHACAIRYATHASLITGPHVDPVSKRLQEIADDEIVHAGKLRRRIRALGGMPTMKVDAGTHPPSLTLGDIVEENILEEREAIKEYREILKGTSRLDVLLYETLEDILKDEQEHLEELQDLAPPGVAAPSVADEAYPQDFNGRP